MTKFKEIALWYVMRMMKFLISVAEEHIPRTCCNIRAKDGRPSFFTAFCLIPTKLVT